MRRPAKLRGVSELPLPARALGRALALASEFVCAAGLLAELAFHAGALHPAPRWLLSLSYEGNLPTWYTSALALTCAALLGWLAAAEPAERRAWRALALGFLAISADEVLGLHEHLSGLFATTGVLYFGWVIPAGVGVAAVGLAFVGFLRRLPRETSRRFLAAGALYVGGALLFELPLGWWAERHGDDDLIYALIDAAEETLEIAGLTLFARALLARLAGRALRIAAV